jgi:hypothetical protein
VRPYLETPFTKKKKKKNRANGVVQGEGPVFKPQYCKKKKKLLYDLVIPPLEK